MKTFTEYTVVSLEDGTEYRGHGATEADCLEGFSSAKSYKITGAKQVPYTRGAQMADIASSLPGDWEAVPQSTERADCNWNLTRSDGLSLYVTTPDWNRTDKFNVGLSSIRHEGSIVSTREKCDSVGIGAKKPPAQIAADIVRRLLPHAETVHAAELAQVASIVACRNAQEETYKAVCDACGTVPDIDLGKRRGRASDLTVYVDCGSLVVQTGGTVRVDLYSLPADKAVKLAAFLKTL